MKLGTLHCVCISRTKALDEVEMKVFAVRKRNFLPKGWKHSTNLAPSEALLFKAKQMERMGEWDERAFRTFYEPKYRYEIFHRVEAKMELKEMKTELLRGYDVVFACYCGDSRICHRRIIGEIFDNIGFPVVYD